MRPITPADVEEVVRMAPVVLLNDALTGASWLAYLLQRDSGGITHELPGGRTVHLPPELWYLVFRSAAEDISAGLESSQSLVSLGRSQPAPGKVFSSHSSPARGSRARMGSDGYRR